MNYINPNCYANQLGGCSEHISAEHIISKNILKEFGEIEASGFHWAMEPKKVGINSLVANILCQNHNSFLSELDSKILPIFIALRDMSSKRISNYKNNQINIDGLLFEMWMLKVLCGYIANGSARKDGGIRINFEIPLLWLEILFGKKGFPQDAGLLISAKNGDQILDGNMIGFVPLIKLNSEQIIGCHLAFRGFPFYLGLEKLKDEKLLFRPKKIKFKNGNFKDSLKINY